MDGVKLLWSAGSWAWTWKVALVFANIQPNKAGCFCAQPRSERLLVPCSGRNTTLLVSDVQQRLSWLSDASSRPTSSEMGPRNTHCAGRYAGRLKIYVDTLHPRLSFLTILSDGPQHDGCPGDSLLQSKPRRALQECIFANATMLHCMWTCAAGRTAAL